MSYYFLQMTGRDLVRQLLLPLLFPLLLLHGCISATNGDPTAVRRGREAPQTSLPAPEENQTPEVTPEEEPAPPEIGYSEAVRQVSRLYPQTLQPLTVKGRIPIILHDLNGDQQPECFALGLPARGVDSRLIQQLSDSSRLFQADSAPVRFSLLVFTNNQGNFRPLQILDLGEHIVYENLSSTSLYANRSLPVALTVSFQTVEGREVELLVFDSANGGPRFRQTLTETLSTQSRLVDIDGNGMLDLLVRERAMEEGTGFETFLTWKRWNGSRFAEHRTSNVVRNLNAFLAASAELLLTGAHQQTVSFLLEPASLRALRRRGWSNQRILIHTLGLEELGVSEFPVVREVVFPPLLEDPFPRQESEPSAFDITYRMIDLNGTSYIAKARLRMLGNPFAERQFAFSPDLD